jgi:hypothetical protein
MRMIEETVSVYQHFDFHCADDGNGTEDFEDFRFAVLVGK